RLLVCRACTRARRPGRAECRRRPCGNPGRARGTRAPTAAPRSSPGAALRPGHRPRSRRARARRQSTHLYACSRSLGFLPAETVADVHGPRRAEIAERVRRAVEIADAPAEGRRVILVERVLEPRADAMTPLGVEVIRRGEIDHRVAAVLDAPDPAHLVIDVADVRDRDAELERHGDRAIRQPELRERLRNVLNLLAGALELRVAHGVAEVR